MTYRVSVVDIRIVNSHGEASLAAWRAASHRVWVSGSRRTLVADAGMNQGQIVARILALANGAGELIDIDLLCHGVGMMSMQGTPLGYVAQLGNGLAVTNVRDWRPLQGAVRKIRILSCGESNPIIGSSPADASREELCFQLAEATSALIVSSPETVYFAVAPEPATWDAGAGIDALGWSRGPVYSYSSARVRALAR